MHKLIANKYWYVCCLSLYAHVFCFMLSLYAHVFCFMLFTVCTCVLFRAVHGMLICAQNCAQAARGNQDSPLRCEPNFRTPFTVCTYVWLLLRMICTNTFVCVISHSDLREKPNILPHRFFAMPPNNRQTSIHMGHPRFLREQTYTVNPLRKPGQSG